MFTEKQFVMYLVEKYSDLKEVYGEHLKDCDELLPHVFMGEVSRKIVVLDRIVLSKGEDAVENLLLKNLLSEFENGMSSDSKEVKELISVSFLENLGDYENKEHLKSYFGKALLNEYKKIF